MTSPRGSHRIEASCNTSTTDLNPFMITSNQNYGMSLEKVKELVVGDIRRSNTAAEEGGPCGSSSSSYDLSFLYKRESDNIGSAVKGSSDSTLAKVLSHRESASVAAKRRRRDGSIFVPSRERCQKEMTEDDIREVLDNYVHRPKEENPLFSTTANDIGLRKPAIATHNGERQQARSQQFSSSFGRVMFRDQGLNTSMTRSKIHVQLDPHFT